MDPVNGVLDASPASPAEALPDFSTLSSTQMADYMKTGEFPSETKPKTDATAEPGQDATGKSGAASDAAEPTTTTQEPPKPNREERRNQKLANELRDARAEIERLKAAPITKTEERKAVTEGDPRPDPDNFKTIKEWQVEDTAWLDRRMDARLTKEREAREQEAQKAESDKSVKSLTQTFAERTKEYRKTLTDDTFADDFTEVSAFVRDYGHLADAIVESEVGPQLITYFGDHFDELEKLAKMTPTAALREFGRLEVSDKIKGPAPKTRTAAKKIGSEVRGSSAVTDEDEQLAEAARTGNMKTYQRIMDKREAAENRR